MTNDEIRNARVPCPLNSFRAAEFVIPSSLGISSFSSSQFGVRRLVAVAELVRVWGCSRKSPKSHDFGYRRTGNYCYFVIHIPMWRCPTRHRLGEPKDSHSRFLPIFLGIHGRLGSLTIAPHNGSSDLAPLRVKASISLFQGASHVRHQLSLRSKPPIRGRF